MPVKTKRSKTSTPKRKSKRSPESGLLSRNTRFLSAAVTAFVVLFGLTGIYVYQATHAAPSNVKEACGAWGVKASVPTAKCIGKYLAAQQWNLDNTTNITGGNYHLPPTGKVTNWQCLAALWTHESSWEWNAQNPTSPAYGIPQSDPGSKMASAGADWVNDATTQIRWGISYISAAYGNPCKAWQHEENNNWYGVNTANGATF